MRMAHHGSEQAMPVSHGSAAPSAHADRAARRSSPCCVGRPSAGGDYAPHSESISMLVMLLIGRVSGVGCGTCSIFHNRNSGISAVVQGAPSGAAPSRLRRRRSVLGAALRSASPARPVPVSPRARIWKRQSRISRRHARRTRRSRPRVVPSERMSGWSSRDRFTGDPASGTGVCTTRGCIPSRRTRTHCCAPRSQENPSVRASRCCSAGLRSMSSGRKTNPGLGWDPGRTGYTTWLPSWWPWRNVVRQFFLNPWRAPREGCRSTRPEWPTT